jgi:hypothetical protein
MSDLANVHFVDPLQPSPVLYLEAPHQSKNLRFEFALLSIALLSDAFLRHAPPSSRPPSLAALCNLRTTLRYSLVPSPLGAGAAGAGALGATVASAVSATLFASFALASIASRVACCSGVNVVPAFASWSLSC